MNSASQKDEQGAMELTIEVRAKPGKFQELYQTFQALLPLIRKEKGCLDCRIYQDVDDGETFFLLIHWEALTNLEHYLRSSMGVALFGAIDLLTEKVRIRIDSDAPWAGIEILKRMRKESREAVGE